MRYDNEKEKARVKLGQDAISVYTKAIGVWARDNELDSKADVLDNFLLLNFAAYGLNIHGEPRPGRRPSKAKLMEARDRAVLALNVIEKKYFKLAAPTAPEAPAAGEGDAAQAKALDSHEYAVLNFLGEEPERLWVQPDIEAGANTTRRTVGKKLKSLRVKGFVSQPGGKRSSSELPRSLPDKYPVNTP